MWDPWPDAGVHLEWGERGAGEAADRGDDVIVVDTFAFSTTLTMAVERGARVAPVGRGETAPPDTFVLAKERDDPDARVTLSPLSIVRVQAGDRLALTSLNGAAVVAACRHAPRVVVGCVRNRSAVAAAIRPDRRTTVVACAERWSSIGAGHGVRPALEDWLGAGAIIAALSGVTLSPEAQAAATTFTAAGDNLETWLRECVSGRELVARGWGAELDLLVALDASPVVPVLAADGFFEAS